MSTPDYELFPLFGYDVAGPPSGPVDPGPELGPSSLQVNSAPAGYNVPVDYTGPLLIGSPGGEGTVVLTDPAAIAQYRDDARDRVLGGVLSVAALPLLPVIAGLGAAMTGGATSSTPGIGGESRLYWQDPQVNFPPRFPGGEPMPSPRVPPITNFPVPYEPPGSVGPFAYGGIGAILTGVIAAMWEGWPNALDPELGPYDTRAPRAAPRDETPAEGPEFGPPEQQQIPGPYGDNPLPPPFPEFGGGPGQDALPEDIGLGPVPDMGPPQGARQPAPAPAPAQPSLPPWVWPVIGGIGAIGLSRAGRSRSSMTLPSVSVLPSPGATIDDLTELVAELRANELGGQSASTTYLPQTASGGVWDVQPDDGCNCGPKRSGKKRKCLARAQLSWRSGPKKGRAAGSRCYRFAD